MERLNTRLHVFGSACHLVVSGDSQLLAQATTELQRLERKFCYYQPDSVINALNQNAGTGIFTPLDAESRSLFDYTAALWDQSHHIFDPSTRPLQNCYNKDGRLLASKQQLHNMLKLVGWSAIEITDEGARLPRKGMLIDLNSCIRPYAVDCVRKLLLREGVKHALIEMERDVATIGKDADGANWLIGLRHPLGPRAAIARIKVNNQGYAMRGDYERRITLNGEFFSRALSPVDGQPIPGLLSVVVVADSCLAASGAATVARLKTEQAGINWLNKLGLPWLAIDRQMVCHGPLFPG
jgi:thiamine biosynthesis lipoprotein